jgi:hypothetical protein
MAGDLEAAAEAGHVPDSLARIDAMESELQRVAEVLAQ